MLRAGTDEILKLKVVRSVLSRPEFGSHDVISMRDARYLVANSPGLLDKLIAADEKQERKMNQAGIAIAVCVVSLFTVVPLLVAVFPSANVFIVPLAMLSFFGWLIRAAGLETSSKRVGRALVAVELPQLMAWYLKRAERAMNSGAAVYDPFLGAATKLAPDYNEALDAETVEDLRKLVENLGLRQRHHDSLKAPYEVLTQLLERQSSAFPSSRGRKDEPAPRK